MNWAGRWGYNPGGSHPQRPAHTGRTDWKVGCRSEPCGWEMPDNCACQACGADDPTLAAMWEAATGWLFDRTCGRFPGVCPVVVRPCRPQCSCECLCTCSTQPERTMDLRDAFCYPVAQPDAAGVWPITVVVDGAQWVQGVDFWMADQWTLVTCRDWPAQNLCAPAGTDGTWEIAARIGRPAPALLTLAAADLACELVKACKGQDTCLPDGVRSVSRRGLTMDVNETITYDGTSVGVATVDLALAQWACAEADAWFMWRPVEDRWRFQQWSGAYPHQPPGG